MGRVIVGTWVWDGAGHHQVEDWPHALSQCRTADDGFVWIGMDEPDPEELKRLAKELDLHPLAVEDAILGGQRPKMDRYDNALLIVLRPLEYDEAKTQVETRELTLFVGPHYIVSVRRGGHTPLKDVRYRLDQPGPLSRTAVGAVHGILDAVVDHYVTVADALEDDLDDIEREVFAGDRDTDATTIYALKREVQESRRAMAPLVEPLTALARGDVPLVTPTAKPFFNDVLDHLVRATDRVEGFDRSLTDVLSVHLSQVSVRQNEDARRISAWAAMGLVPTLIAGIYGMNFANIPELRWHYGYFYALALMVVVCLALYRMFRRSGWL
jgi:magnesium transporter